MTKPVQQLSWLEKLDLIPGALSLLLTAAAALFTGLRRSEKDASTYYLHVAFAVMRKSTARFSPRQLQYVLPTSDQVYASYARRAKGKTQIVQLPSGASGYWIGDSKAKNVIVWFHGELLPAPTIACELYW
ncbi:hypothetical protein NLG97_g4415 [Lecanicillium saksenae]|uniref:Uncharacterized protein n=1 Tax=Lecanicillium saksenae TaxID=468837 RepID=A0ACC1QYH5_9HYPO|nr:hypothetical protein NLG97_g4415 [Lecanicillium saksenae]